MVLLLTANIHFTLLDCYYENDNPIVIADSTARSSKIYYINNIYIYIYTQAAPAQILPSSTLLARQKPQRRAQKQNRKNVILVRVSERQGKEENSFIATSVTGGATQHASAYPPKF